MIFYWCFSNAKKKTGLDSEIPEPADISRENSDFPQENSVFLRKLSFPQFISTNLESPVENSGFPQLADGNHAFPRGSSIPRKKTQGKL